MAAHVDRVVAVNAVFPLPRPGLMDRILVATDAEEIDAILVVNNVRDIETDAVAGKRTLAVRFGRTAACAEYGAFVLTPYLWLPVLAFLAGPSFGPLLPLLTLPLAVRLHRAVRSERGAALNERLAATAQLEIAFSGLLALGWLL